MRRPWTPEPDARSVEGEAVDRTPSPLTERRIREAKPEAKTRILWDSQIKGLGLRITPRGTKSYILNYRVAMRECRATLAPTLGALTEGRT